MTENISFYLSVTLCFFFKLRPPFRLNNAVAGDVLCSSLNNYPNKHTSFVLLPV